MNTIAGDFPVTAHAVLRYLTRIENFDIAPIVRMHGRAAANLTLAQAAATVIGTTFAELQRRICPEHLVAVVKGGAARIRREGMVLHCQDGRVITVVEELRHRHCRIPSKREIRKGHQRLARRRK